MAGGSEKVTWRARVMSTVARPRSMAPKAPVVASGYTLANIFEADFQNPNSVGHWNGNGNDFEESTADASLQDRFGELQATTLILIAGSEGPITVAVLHDFTVCMHVIAYVETEKERMLCFAT